MAAALPALIEANLLLLPPAASRCPQLAAANLSVDVRAMLGDMLGAGAAPVLVGQVGQGSSAVGRTLPMPSRSTPGAGAGVRHCRCKLTLGCLHADYRGAWPGGVQQPKHELQGAADTGEHC